MQQVRNSDQVTYKLGSLRFAITGDDPVVPYIRAEFAPILEKASASLEEPHIRFHFVDEVVKPTGCRKIGPLQVASDCYYTSLEGYTYRVSQKGGVVNVDIKSVPLTWKQRLAPDWLIRLADWNYLSPHETLAKNFIYSVFDYLSQLVQLPLGQTYLHASAIELEGKGVLLAGWGGVGKSSTMLKLVLEKGWRYLSDDLVVLDQAGRIWLSPKNLQVYAYNLADQRALESALFDERAILDRAAWGWRRRVYGPGAVRRRVSPETLFGTRRVAKEAELALALFMDRTDQQDFSVVPISQGEAADRAAMTLLNELQPLTDLSVAMHSGGVSAILPRVDAFHEMTEKVLGKGLKRVQPYAVSVPLRAKPDEVTEYLLHSIHELKGGKPLASALRTSP